MLKLKLFFRKYKSLCVAILAIILFVVLFLVTKRNVSGKLFESFRKNVDEYTKYNKKLDKETFKKLEEIEKKYQNETNKVRSDINKKVKEDLRKIEDDPKALENWYNNFLNSDIFNSTTK